MKKLTTLLAVILLAPASLWAQLKVTFVNVGQGDAIYIELPNGKNALIDGGSSGVLVDNFLRSKGVTKIDYVALTHPHSDHYRGLKKVFTNYQVNNYYDTKAENVDAAGDNNLRQLASVEPGCRTFYPKPGDLLNWDPAVNVKVFNACWEPVQIRENDEANNCSLVVKLSYNGNGILLTGDANSDTEQEMLSHFSTGLRANILKVGHHGSRTSTSDAFLARVRPDYAFISVGLGNKYGHPHQEALSRLLNAGAKIYLTTDGTQSVVIPAPSVSKPGKPLVVREGKSIAETVPAGLTWDPAEIADFTTPAFEQLSGAAAK